MPLRDIASDIGRHLNLPVVRVTAEDAGDHFSWLAAFASFNNPPSRTLTQQRLGGSRPHPWQRKCRRGTTTVPNVVAMLQRTVPPVGAAKELYLVALQAAMANYPFRS